MVVFVVVGDAVVICLVLSNNCSFVLENGTLTVSLLQFVFSLFLPGRCCIDEHFSNTSYVAIGGQARCTIGIGHECRGKN